MLLTYRADTNLGDYVSNFPFLVDKISVKLIIIITIIHNNKNDNNNNNNNNKNNSNSNGNGNGKCLVTTLIFVCSFPDAL